MKKSYKHLRSQIARPTQKPFMQPSMTGIQKAIENKKMKDKMEEFDEAMMTAQAISVSIKKR